MDSRHIDIRIALPYWNRGQRLLRVDAELGWLARTASKGEVRVEPHTNGGRQPQFPSNTVDTLDLGKTIRNQRRAADGFPNIPVGLAGGGVVDVLPAQPMIQGNPHLAQAGGVRPEAVGKYAADHIGIVIDLSPGN